MNSTRASMHGPSIDTFMGPQGNVTEEDYYGDEEDRGRQGEQTDDEEEESDNEEQKTVATVESTLIQSTLDQSLPLAQPRLSDMSVARVKMREEQAIKDMERQVVLKRQERERQEQIAMERIKAQQLRDREKAIQTSHCGQADKLRLSLNQRITNTGTNTSNIGANSTNTGATG